jgi:hypothetical protein
LKSRFPDENEPNPKSRQAPPSLNLPVLKFIDKYNEIEVLMAEGSY